MPAFLNRVFKRENTGKKSFEQAVVVPEPKAPQHTDAWLRTTVTPEEVQELLRGCTNEVKTRGARNRKSAEGLNAETSI